MKGMSQISLGMLPTQPSEPTRSGYRTSHLSILRLYNLLS